MSNLDNAIARNADFTHVNAVGITACNADFTGSIMIGANFTRSDMTGANLTNVTIDANTRFGNLAGASIQGMRELTTDGYQAVNYERLQSLGATGVGLNVAAERACAQGALSAYISSDMPERAPESAKDAIAGLVNVQGGDNASRADYGSLASITPDKRTPSQSQQQGTLLS
jgi:uncharacterized protein YjbI with pentapeptide repeats